MAGEWDRRKADSDFKEAVLREIAQARSDIKDNTSITSGIDKTLAVHCEKVCALEKSVPALKTRIGWLEKIVYIGIGGGLVVLFFIKLMHLEILF